MELNFFTSVSEFVPECLWVYLHVCRRQQVQIRWYMPPKTRQCNTLIAVKPSAYTKFNQIGTNTV